MEFRKVLALRGPNIWASYPVLEVWLDLGPYKDCSSDNIPGFNDRLVSWLPSLIEHRCSIGERSGFLERLRRGTYPAHILEHVCLELQCAAVFRLHSFQIHISRRCKNGRA
jgi:cyanophycin synthetase